MPTLTGLPGIRRKHVEAAWARSPSGFLKGLGTQRACTFASDHGSISVWIDDRGKYWCCFCRFRCIVDQNIVSSKAAVRRWLVEWLPLCHRAQTEG
jgi:hypothetical protein